MKKIGLAIALGKEANSHTQTFIEAINYSLKHFPEFKRNTLKIVNDEKSPDGGIRAAGELIEWGADVVVGHFSSIAALAALPVYSCQSIPLILPASTACELDYYNKANQNEVFRYQKDNSELITCCLDDGIYNRRGGNVYVVVQDNAYGNCMMDYIPLMSDARIIRELPGRIEKEGTFIIIGYSDFASRIIRQLSQTQIYRILLVDDSDSSDAYSSCILRPLRLSRVRSASHLSEHGRKRPYWNETLLALSLAACPLPPDKGRTDAELRFSTYLGLQGFDRSHCYDGCKLVSEDLD